MKQLGKIIAILNQDYVLLSSTETLDQEDIITVFFVFHNTNQDQLEIEEIFIPKGEIEIVCPQTESIFLAKRFREVSYKTSYITEPPPFAKSISNIVSSFAPQKREVVEEVHGPWSAEFNSKQSLNVSFNKIISTDDIVGKV